MVGILLATHGDFAEGIKMSGSMLFGDQPNVKAVTLQPSDGPDALRAKMEEAIATFDDPDQVLILVDLWGGTPFNQSNNLIAGHEDHWAIVAGLNLPMLVDALASRDFVESAQELAKQIIGSGKEGIRVFPAELEPEEAAAPAAAPRSASCQGSGHRSRADTAYHRHPGRPGRRLWARCAREGTEARRGGYPRNRPRDIRRPGGPIPVQERRRAVRPAVRRTGFACASHCGGGYPGRLRDIWARRTGGLDAGTHPAPRYTWPSGRCKPNLRPG